MTCKWAELTPYLDTHFGCRQRGKIVPCYFGANPAWGQPPTWTIHEAATVVGSDPRTVARWIKSGVVPLAATDRVACRLGVWPGHIWVEWEADSLEEADRVVAAAGTKSGKSRERRRQAQLARRAQEVT